MRRTQRRTPIQAGSWRQHEDGWYVEPRWASRLLAAADTLFDLGPVHDPCCGQGRILDSFHARGHRTSGGDIKRRPGLRDDLHDFTEGDYFAAPARVRHHVVMNPPFRLTEEFVELALNQSDGVVAVLQRQNWLGGVERRQWFERFRPSAVYVIPQRLSCLPGDVAIKLGTDGSGGIEQFAWFVWEPTHAVDITRLEWLPSISAKERKSA